MKLNRYEKTAVFLIEMGYVVGSLMIMIAGAMAIVRMW